VGDLAFVPWEQIEAVEVDWLVPDLIAFGYCTLVSSPGGSGKSFMLWDVAAKASRGERVCGDPLDAPVTTLLCYLEGRRSDPREQLEASDAAPGGVLVLTQSSAFDLALADDLEAAIVEHGAKLVIVDTLLKAAPTIDENSYGETTSVLSPLDGVADRTGAAIVLLHHDRKGGQGEQERVLGSAGLVSSVRSVVGVEKHANSRRVVLLKSNLGPPAGTAIDVTSVRVGDNAFALTWSEPSDASESGRPARPVERCIDRMRSELARGERRAVDVRATLRGEGFADRTISRARDALGVIVTGATTAATWTLAASAGTSDP
jgi:hypothetical protein